jgi:hypothetical protein
MNLRACRVCKKELPETEFYVRDRSGKRRGGQAMCKSCNSEYMKNWIKNQTPEQRASRLSRQRDNDLRREFGITLADYDRMLAAQHGVCASCSRPPSGNKNNSVLHVDHDHETGDVRGLLCGDCNRALGILRDDPDAIWQLLIYARKNQRPRLKLVA